MAFRATLVATLLALLALPAEARGRSSTTHGSAPVGGRSSPPTSSHGSAPVNGGRGRGPSLGTPYPRTFIPRYGYGYGYGYYRPLLGYGFSPWLVAPGTPETSPGPTQLRVTAGIQAVALLVGETGVTVGVHGQLEGERWGVALAAQNVSSRQAGATGGLQSIQQAQVRVTYAFLTGRFGRLRGELGGDVLFAPRYIALAPSAGLAGSLWVGGPVALEASVLVSPLPFWQLDYQAGVAVGLGPVGLRAGWRTQVLDDRGAVDGTVHHLVFMGPYLGVAVVF
jgi:hypothetical protein